MTEKVIEMLKAWGCDTAGALDRLCDDKALYLSCIEMMIEDDGFEKLAPTIATGDFEGAFTIAHTLKGVAGNLGITPLFDALFDIVEVLRAKNFGDLSPYLDRVQKRYAEFSDIVLKCND